MRMGIIFKFVLVVLILVFSTVGYASDPCESVQREMTFGETAVEFAKGKEDYLKAAQEFEAAVQKAPQCAAAQFNLGVTLEKAEHYLAANKAYETYVNLAPKAEDFEQVMKKIYRLEYLAKQNLEVITTAAKKDWNHLSGEWCPVESNNNCEGRFQDKYWDYLHVPYYVEISGSNIKITKHEEQYNKGYNCIRTEAHELTGEINEEGIISGEYTYILEFQKGCNPFSPGLPWRGSFDGKVLRSGEIIKFDVAATNPGNIPTSGSYKLLRKE